MRIIGVDPGFTGAIAWIDLNAMTLAVAPIPVLKRQMSSGQIKTLVDEDKLSALLARNGADEAWLEDVWSSPQMGVVSAFSFGEGKGVLKGCLAGVGIKRLYVDPARWKNDLRISADKTLAKRQARALFPRVHNLLSSSGKAEAALIALYGVLTHPTLIHNLKDPLTPATPK